MATVGAATSLVAAGSLALFALSAVVAFRGWPDMKTVGAPANTTAIAADPGRARAVAPLSKPIDLAKAEAGAERSRKADGATAPSSNVTGAAKRVAKTAVPSRSAAAPTSPPAAATPSPPAPGPSKPGDPVRNTTGGLGDTTNEATKGLGEVVRPVSPQLADVVDGVGKVVGDTLNGAGQALGELVDGLLGPPKR
jgi:hypothetical protein